MSIKKIVSGGQRGVDVAALDVAIELGIPIGGYLPKGRKQIGGGVLPVEKYPGMQETDSADPIIRTTLNVRHSDATLIFSHGPLTHGSLDTLKMAEREKKPYLHVDFDQCTQEQAIVVIRAWLAKHNPHVLNIAGPPDESETPRPSEKERTLKPGEGDPLIAEKVKAVLRLTLLM